MKSSIKGALFILALLLSSCNAEKIAYVDINLLFESFDYKKKMTADYNKVKGIRQHVVDSLEMELNVMASKLEKDNQMNLETQTEFEKKKKDLYQLAKQYDEDNDVLLSTYNQQTINQLNAYIKDYGKKSGYSLIVGADNKGSILYGDSEIDITQEILDYVNERYKGGKP